MKPVTKNLVLSELDGAPVRPLRADALRNQQRILAAARQLFPIKGLDITLDLVAEHAGVGVGTVYRRFANKHELIAEVFADHVRRLVDRVDEAYECADPWEGLVRCLGQMCEQLALNRGLSEVVRIEEGSDARLAYVSEHLQPAVARVMQRAQQAGVLRPEIETGDFFALIQMVDAVAVFARDVNPEVWRRYFDIMLDGMRADSIPRQPVTVRALNDEEIAAAKQHCAARR